MKYATALLVATLSICTATILPPYRVQCFLVDRVAAAAKDGIPGHLAALELLERLAVGRIEGASPDLEASVGLEAGQLHKPEFKVREVRLHAIQRIGDVLLPEALTFLQKLTKDDLGPDISGSLWPAAQIALHQAQLNRLPDEPAKIRFLEDATSERGPAASWATNELCERGSYESVGFIRTSIRRRNPTPRGEADITYCEARMAVISRDPDQIKALGSFLSVANGGTDNDLLGWAINRLHDINSARADAEVQRYAREIDSLPEGSSLKNTLGLWRVHIRTLLARPPK
jgi:hypothetical protein